MSEEQNEIIFEPKIFYLKNSIFEGKMIPNVFFKDYKIDVSMNVNIDTQKVGDNENSEMWNVLVTFRVTGKNASADDEVVYEIVVKYGGVFEIGNYEGENIERICRVHCANMIFPYAREEVLNKVIKSGVPHFFIKPINFSELYKGYLERKSSENNSQDEIEPNNSKQ